MYHLLEIVHHYKKIQRIDDLLAGNNHQILLIITIFLNYLLNYFLKFNFSIDWLDYRKYRSKRK